MQGKEVGQFPHSVLVVGPQQQHANLSRSLVLGSCSVPNSVILAVPLRLRPFRLQTVRPARMSTQSAPNNREIQPVAVVRFGSLDLKLNWALNLRLRRSLLGIDL